MRAVASRRALAVNVPARHHGAQVRVAAAADQLDLVRHFGRHCSRLCCCSERRWRKCMRFGEEKTPRRSGKTKV
jgi:hypothetical protein